MEGCLEGDTIGLLYDCAAGSLTVYKRGRRLGTIVESGLPSAGLCWMVELAEPGDAVQITAADPPPQEPTPP